MLANPYFRDRAQAGQVLAQRLKGVEIESRALVLALPRGGVPVGFEATRATDADLDVFLVRKLGVPGQEELAMGAIASGGGRILNRGLIAQLGLSTLVIDRVTAREQREIERREWLYREGRAALVIGQRNVILVDDGLATGATMLAAVRAVQAQKPERVIVAVPVGSREACAELRQYVDEVICTETPDPFYSVSAWYADFSQTSDTEVRALLERGAHRRV
jgi:putative phosphoribosyl transferase